MSVPVTVIIVNWNGERFLKSCLSSLTTQTVEPHEVIVVDNASSDSSLKIIRQFSSVRLLLQKENIGFARGNNLAINAASGNSEWIALVNPDAFVDARWLETLLLAAEKNPDYEVFSSKLVNAINPNVLDGEGDIYHISGLVWRAGHGQLSKLSSGEAEEIFSPCAAAVLYKRSVLQKLDGFDEDFFCYVEDVDLGFRLRLAGYRCLYVPHSVVKHVGSGTTGSQHSDFAIYHGHRNIVWAYVKNMPGWLFWACLPLHLLMNLLSILVFSFRGKGPVIVKAKRDAIRGLPKMWKKRIQIQKSRTVSIMYIWRLLNKCLLPIKDN
jgi:GT2 family glycosyltransferase